MVFGNVEVAIMSGLEHGNETVKSSAEHWGIRHLHAHTVHSQRIFWVDLKYSRLSSIAFEEMVGISGPGHELKVDVATAPILAHIC